MHSFQSPVDPTQTTDLCRYCLMCRHVCPVTYITQDEATSPHGWGLLISSVGRGLTGWNEDTVDILYQCADCGLCRAHCATDQPLPLAINAGRADVAARNLAPAVVYELQQKLQRWGNVYAAAEIPVVTGRAEAGLIVGAAAHHLHPQTVEAALKLLAATGVNAAPLAAGRETPYLPNTLGLPVEARDLAEITLADITALGASRVFVLGPGDIYAYTTLLAYLGLRWPDHVHLLDGVTFLAGQLEAGQLAFRPIDLGEYAFYDPDHTVRVPGRWSAPRRLLAALTATPPIELFWRQERAMPCGASGGLPFTQPALAAALAEARLAEAQARGVKTLITDDPQTLYHLQRYAKDIAVKGLYELLAEQLVTPRPE